MALVDGALVDDHPEGTSARLRFDALAEADELPDLGLADAPCRRRCDSTRRTRASSALTRALRSSSFWRLSSYISRV